MEIIGDGLGLHREDLYKRLKMINDIDEIIVETREPVKASWNGVDEFAVSAKRCSQ